MRVNIRRGLGGKPRHPNNETMPDEALPSASVVVATYNRPDHVQECLTHMARQTVAPAQVIVVDASPDARTREVVAGFDGVEYLRSEHGPGTTATSRAIGTARVTSDVVAFVDDDAYAEPTWLERILTPYADVRVGAVGGRALNDQPGEESEGVDRIGLFLPDGSLTGFFAADPGKDIWVDHLLGANMSMRMSALAAIGGIEDFYPGTCLREETDPVLRLRLGGWGVRYTPSAVVRHVAGPYAKGRRFDMRYTYFAQRNHVVLLARTVGARDARFVRHLSVAARQAGDEVRYARDALRRGSPVAVVRGVGNGLVRSVVSVVGTVAGIVEALRLGAAGHAGPAATGLAPTVVTGPAPEVPSRTGRTMP